MLDKMSVITDRKRKQPTSFIWQHKSMGTDPDSRFNENDLHNLKSSFEAEKQIEVLSAQ